MWGKAKADADTSRASRGVIGLNSRQRLTECLAMHAVSTACGSFLIQFVILSSSMTPAVFLNPSIPSASTVLALICHFT